MNISFPKQLEEFIAEQVRNGRFESNDEVVRAAIRQMEELERQRELEAFRAAFVTWMRIPALEGRRSRIWLRSMRL